MIGLCVKDDGVDMYFDNAPVIEVDSNGTGLTPFNLAMIDLAATIALEIAGRYPSNPDNCPTIYSPLSSITS